MTSYSELTSGSWSQGIHSHLSLRSPWNDAISTTSNRHSAIRSHPPHPTHLSTSITDQMPQPGRHRGSWNGKTPRSHTRSRSTQLLIFSLPERRLYQPTTPEKTVSRPVRGLVGQAGAAQLWRAVHEDHDILGMFSQKSIHTSSPDGGCSYWDARLRLCSPCVEWLA